MGVVAADLNNDGRIDLYVTNDMCPNFVFLNQGDGRFQDVTDTSGAGYGPDGLMRAGMGVDAEDINGDGLPDTLCHQLLERSRGPLHQPGRGSLPGPDRVPAGCSTTVCSGWAGAAP